MQKQEEANSLTLTNTPAANLNYWHQAHNMAFPISGDILTIVRKANATNDPILATQIVRKANATNDPILATQIVNARNT